MKKIIKLIIAIFILVLIFELITYIFKDSHNVTYTIDTNNDTFKVNEIYKNKKYYFKITLKDYKYSFEIDDDFHKNKKIIDKIYTYQDKDLYCIYPKIGKSEKTNILCSKNGKSYSYEYFKERLKPFVKTLQKDKNKSLSWNEKSNSQKQIETLTAYPKNINDGTFIYVYKYDGFFSVNNKELNKINLFKNDTYLNTLGALIDKYYIVPNYDDKYDYNELYVIDITKDKIKKEKLKYEISKDSYINGIINDEIYIFDKDELKQYKIFKKGKKQKEVGNKENGALYYNLKFETKDIYSFRDNELKFKTIDDHIKEVENLSSIKFITKKDDTYYYQTKDNSIYYYSTNSKQKVLLLKEEISYFTLIKDTLYFISDDTLYSYNFIEGLKKLISYSELSFNSNNRIAIYME